MSKDVYYFSHDCNARYDPKILALRSVYGVKGYGLFFILLEIMRGEEGYKIRCDDLFYTSLSMQTCEDAATLKAITEDCVNKFGLFKTDGEYIWSESFLRRMEKMEEFRDRMSEAGKRSAEKRRLKQNGRLVEHTLNIKENERKIKRNEKEKGVPENVENSVENFSGAAAAFEDERTKRERVLRILKSLP